MMMAIKWMNKFYQELIPSPEFIKEAWIIRTTILN